LRVRGREKIHVGGGIKFRPSFPEGADPLGKWPLLMNKKWPVAGVGNTKCEKRAGIRGRRAHPKKATQSRTKRVAYRHQKFKETQSKEKSLKEGQRWVVLGRRKEDPVEIGGLEYS